MNMCTNTTISPDTSFGATFHRDMDEVTPPAPADLPEVALVTHDETGLHLNTVEGD